jgi:rubredoxin
MVQLHLDIDEFKAESACCPQCEGHGAFIGDLGTLAWFRCRACGWEFIFNPEGN